MIQASIITLSFNRPEALQHCLRSLAGQTVETKRFESIIVDVSDEPVSGIIEAFEKEIQIHHVRAANGGVAANRNIGAAEARAPLLLFIDDDCRAEPDWLENMLACARSNPGALIGGGVINSNPKNAVSTAGQVITEAVDLHFNAGKKTPTFFPGLNFGMPREDYLALGGCDESFGRLAAEDREFSARWRRSGRPLAAAPMARVVHDHRMDIPGFMRQYFNYGRGAWKLHECISARSDEGIPNVVRSHVGLVRHLATPISRLEPVMQVKVIPLLILWELMNLFGFVWQSILSRRGRWRPDDG